MQLLPTSSMGELRPTCGLEHLLLGGNSISFQEVALLHVRVWAMLPAESASLQAVLLGVEELTGDNRYLCGFCTSKQVHPSLLPNCCTLDASHRSFTTFGGVNKALGLELVLSSSLKSSLSWSLCMG